MRSLLLVVLSWSSVVVAQQPRGWETAMFPDCALDAVAVPSSWPRVTDRAIELRIPADLEEVENAWSVHGARKWVNGSLSVSVTWGHWDRFSFLGQPTVFCSLQCGEHLALLARLEESSESMAKEAADGESLDLALFVEPVRVSGHAPLISARSAALEDESILLSILQGACQSFAAAPISVFEGGGDRHLEEILDEHSVQ